MFRLRERFARNDFLRDSSYVFVGALTVNFFNYVYHALVSRGLGPERYGAVSSLLAMLAIVSVPATIATTVVVTYASEFHALGDAAHLRGLIRRVTSAAFVAAAGLFALGAIFAGPIARYLRIDDVPAVVTTAFVLALSAAIPLLRGILQGMQRFRAYAISAAIESAGRAALGVAFVLGGLGLVGAIGGHALAMVVSLAYTLIVVGPTRGASPVRIDPRRLLRTTSTSIVAILCLTILGFGDLILVKHYFVPYDAGLYGAIALSGKLELFAMGFIPQVVLAKAAGRAASGQASRAIFLQAGGVIAVAAAVFLALLALAPELVLRVLVGKAFLAAAPFVLPYGIAMTCLAITTLIANYEIAHHRFRFAIPLVLAVLGEILAIIFDHHSIDAVIRIVIGANAFAVVVAGFDLVLRPRVVNVVTASLFAASIASLWGCGRGPSLTPSVAVAAPVKAFALAALGDGRAVVLAGDRRGKGVWLLPLHAGTRTSFSVSNSATSIATTPSDEILIGLAVGAAGAVEVWSLDGHQRATIPVSGPVVAVTSAPSPIAIVARRGITTAEEIDVGSKRVARVVPLPRSVIWGADCVIGEQRGVVVADDQSVVTLVRLSDAATARAGSKGREPLCSPQTHAIYAISPLEGRDDTALEVMSLRSLLQTHEVPTSLYAVAQTLAPDGGVYVLESDARESTVSRYSRRVMTAI